MITRTGDPKSRRRFLQLLAASPLLPYVNLPHSMMKALQQEQNTNAAAIDDVLHVQDPDGVPASVLKSMQEFDDNLRRPKMQSRCSTWKQWPGRGSIRATLPFCLPWRTGHATWPTARALPGCNFVPGGWLTPARSICRSRCLAPSGIRRSSSARSVVRQRVILKPSWQSPERPRPRDICRRSPTYV